MELPLRWRAAVLGVFLLLVSLGLSSHAMSVPANRPLASVGVLLFMGILLAGFHVHEVAALWESIYGRILVAKVAVAGAVMVAGFWNLVATPVPPGAH